MDSNFKTASEKHFDDFSVIGRACGIKNPKITVVFLAVIIMVIIFGGLLILASNPTSPFLFVVSIVLLVVLPPLIMPILFSKIAENAKLTCSKTHLVLRTGRIWPFKATHSFLFSQIEVCDVEKWFPNPNNRYNKNVYLYCLRAHMNDGHFVRLLATGKTRIRAREAASNINSVLAVKNGVLKEPSTSIASMRAQHKFDDYDIATSPPELTNELGEAQKYSEYRLGFISLLVVTILGGMVFGGWKAWNSVRDGFQEAVTQGDVSKVENYMNFGFDPFDYNALYHASNAGSVKFLEMLFELGANPDAYVKALITRALTSAEIQQNKSNARMYGLSFLDKKTEDNYIDELPLLALASNRNRVKVVRLLLQKGADVNLQAKQGEINGEKITDFERRNRVKYAWEFAKSADVKYLLKAKTESWAPAILAAFLNDKTTFENLNIEGTDIKSPMKNGFTPLRFAVKENREETVRILVSSGGYIESEGVQLVLDATKNGNKNIVETLLKQKMDLCQILNREKLPQRLQPPRAKNALQILAGFKEETIENFQLGERMIWFAKVNPDIQELIKEVTDNCIDLSTKRQ